MPVKETIPSSLSLEAAMYEQGVERFRKVENKARFKGQQYTTPVGLALGRQLLTPFALKVQTFISEIAKGKPGAHASIAPYLMLLDPWRVAFLTCKAMLDKLTQSTPLTKQAIRIGTILEDECRLTRFGEVMPGYYYRLYSDTMEWTTNIRRRKIRLMQAMVDKEVAWQPWDIKVKTKIGIKLIEMFMETSGIIQIRNHRSRNHHLRLVIEATPEALKQLDDKNSILETLKPLYGPLTEVPKDWVSFHEGGFHTLPLTLVKTDCKEHRDILKHWPMPKVYEAVNALQRTPYKINRPVYEVVRRLKDSGLAIAGLPAPFDPNLHHATGWSQKAFETYREGQILLHQNLEVELILRTARDYLDHKEIFFVHTLDFRGRAYPVTSYLSPQGSDLNRGLLTFADSQAKPLGNDGACWLAIHGANSWGNKIDKLPLQGRIDWVHENSDRIISVALDPYADYWWTEADDPIQFLAFAYEWRNYCEQGFDYPCALPIAVDGSNNALQHFSALARDPVIGRATNLVPDNNPNDIYQEVCDEVNRIINEEASNGYAIALQWQGHVTRADVKRPAMTQCYGAKQFGFQHMIFEDTLKPWRLSAKPWPFERDGWKAAIYLAKVIKKALSTRLQAMEAYMKYLRTIAYLFAGINLPLRWVNPAGFPIVQSYMRKGTHQIKTHLSGRIIRPSLNIEDPHKLDRRAQSNGISANFIHSLDSAAMMLTLEQALANDITAFRMIHDSYATVPADVPLLNFCLRHAFAEMYTDDIVAHFLEDIQTIFEQGEFLTLPNRPKQGDLDINLVNKSDYFFA